MITCPWTCNDAAPAPPVLPVPPAPAGTLAYMAPEVLRCPIKGSPDQHKADPSAASYDVGADAWSVGVLAFELITGSLPFNAKEKIDLADQILRKEVSRPVTAGGNKAEWSGSPGVAWQSCLRLPAPWLPERTPRNPHASYPSRCPPCPRGPSARRPLALRTPLHPVPAGRVPALHV